MIWSVTRDSYTDRLLDIQRTIPGALALTRPEAAHRCRRGDAALRAGREYAGRLPDEVDPSGEVRHLDRVRHQLPRLGRLQPPFSTDRYLGAPSPERGEC